MTYCVECQVEDHDVCSLSPGCPCCKDTLEGMVALGLGLVDEKEETNEPTSHQ